MFARKILSITNKTKIVYNVHKIVQYLMEPIVSHVPKIQYTILHKNYAYHAHKVSFFLMENVYAQLLHHLMMELNVSLAIYQNIGTWMIKLVNFVILDIITIHI